MTTITEAQKCILRRTAVHLAHYRCLCNQPDDEETLFSVSSANAHLIATIIGWAMVFGNRDEQTHWSKVITWEGDRRTVVEGCGILWSDWRQYHGTLCACRNQFAAHHDMARGIPASPCFDDALKVAFAYYDDRLRDAGSAEVGLEDIYEKTKSSWPRNPPDLDRTDSIVTTTTTT